MIETINCEADWINYFDHLRINFASSADGLEGYLIEIRTDK